MEEKDPNKLIVVLGMHRAGTSVITRGLKVLGVDLGDNLQPSGFDNPTGYWEDLDILQLNIEMLYFLKTDWHFLTPIKSEDMDALYRTGYFLRAGEMLRKKMAGGPIFAFKDPRVAKLLPFWKKVFAHGQLETYYVLAIRHPLSVCKSLAKRDGFEFEKGCLLWLEHVIDSFSGTEGESRVVVDYDCLMKSPETEIARVARKFQLQIDNQELEKFRLEFLDNKLRHTFYKRNDLTLDIPPLAQEIYSKALEIAADRSLMEDETFKNSVKQWSQEFSRLKLALVLADKLELRLADRDHHQEEGCKIDIFFSNTPDGFVESKKIGRKIKIMNEVTDAELPLNTLGKDDTFLRIDLGCRPGMFLLKSIRVLDHDDNIIWQWDGTKEGFRGFSDSFFLETEKRMNYISTGNDPQIFCPELPRNSSPDKIIISLQQNAELDGQIISYNNSIAERDWKIASLGQALAEYERRIRKSTEQLNKSTEQLNIVRSDVERLSVAINRILHSRSWRFMWPYRFIGKYVRLLLDLYLVWRTGLFDSAYYLARNPDVAISGVTPLFHFIRYGAKEGRNPSPLFDTAWYLLQHPDVAATGVNPLLHFIKNGVSEKRLPRQPSSIQHQEDQPRSSETIKDQANLFSTATARPRQRYCPPQPLVEHSTVYAFTSICLNYLPKALVLAETLKKHNPHVRFCLLVNEPIPAGLLDSFNIFDEVATIDDLDIPDKQAWLFGHSVVELCTAVKGFFMLQLLERPECSTAFYFDPDIAVFSSIDVLLNALKDSSILLTPHQTEPEETIETIIDNEICSLKHGIYNLGFLGVKSSSEGLRFARWWRDRLLRFCRADIPAGLFTDQRWIDLVPAFFTDFHILRHPGCNVCTWNLTHRRLEGELSKGLTVNGQPLIFYHFSSFDNGGQEIMLNKYGKHMPAALVLRRWYLARTTRPEDKAFSNRRWRYNYFTNGEPITGDQRRLYRDRADLQQAFPDPFTVVAPGSGFYYWYQVEILGRQIHSAPEARGAHNFERLMPEQRAVTAFANHPSDTSRSIIQWAMAKDPVILFVGHHGGGGTEKHLRELAAYIGDRARILLLTPQFNGEILLTTLSVGEHATLCFDPLRELDELVAFLEACRLARIHIHHELGNEHYLAHLVHRLGKPFDFTVHDYYTLAPTPQLMGPDNRFVGEDLVANSVRLLSMSVCSKRPTSLIAWQSEHRWLLTDAARVIAPSHDVARRLTASIPELNVIVAVHPEKRVSHQQIHVERLDIHTHFRIAVLGQISPHKGSEVIRKCARLAQDNNYPLLFDIIGLPLDGLDALEWVRVRISGQYNDSDLQKLIRDRRPHLIWYPALWPETYSYTLSSGFDACLPVVVPNIGAFPERVAGRRWSWVCPWDRDPSTWVAFFMQIRAENFLAGVEPECPGGVAPNRDNFYDHEYLSWCAPQGESILVEGNAKSRQKGHL